MHFFFSPYPWISSNYKYFMATIDSIVTMLVMLTSVLVIIKNIKVWKEHLIPGIVIFFIIAVPFAMIEAYPMGAVRHRMILTILLLPIFSCVIPATNMSFDK